MTFSSSELLVFSVFVLVNIICAVIILPELKKMVKGFRKGVW